jgi:hypothetical protein
MLHSSDLAFETVILWVNLISLISYYISVQFNIVCIFSILLENKNNIIVSLKIA